MQFDEKGAAQIRTLWRGDQIFINTCLVPFIYYSNYNKLIRTCTMKYINSNLSPINSRGQTRNTTGEDECSRYLDSHLYFHVQK